MSESRPPSPVHPRVFNTSVKEMAETQRAPALPASTFIGHPERHNSTSSIFGNQASPVAVHGRPQGPYHPPFATLPPLQQRPSISTSPHHYSRQAVPIAKLLSDDAPQESFSRSRPAPAYGPRSPELSSPPAGGAGPYQHQQHVVTNPPLPHWATTNVRQPPAFQMPRPPPQNYGQSSGLHFPLHSPPNSSNSPSSASFDSGPSPREPFSAVSESFIRHPSISAPSPNLRYELSMRQQPVAARACGFGERDRRVVDPPPILELTVIDAETGKVDGEKTPYVYTTLHCTLINAATYKDESQIEPPHPNMPATQRLMGTAVASPFSGTDEHGRRGTFFVFPDLSCRSPGKFRFQFRLLIVDPLNISVGTTSRIQSSIISESFEVFTAKEFPGMRASSALLKALRKQGLNVAVKKGREATKKATRKTQNADDDSSADEGGHGEDDDGDSDGAHSSGPSQSGDRRKRKRRD